MQANHKIKTINKALSLFLSALLLTSCSVSETSRQEEEETFGSEPTITETAAEQTVTTPEEITAAETEEERISLADITVSFDGDPSTDEITELDIKCCKEVMEKSSIFVLTDSHITAYDIDYDGQDELLVLYDYFFFVFEKNGGKLTESHRTPTTSKEDLTNLNLKTYSDGEERYAYSNFFYDNNAMTSDAVVAIKYDSETDSYNYEYIISWGKIEYGEPVDVFNHAFFRKGWSYLEVAAGPYDNDISQEEFLEIYNKYENLPPWDTYIKEYDLMTE